MAAPVEWKGPSNVDIHCELRVIGHSRSSFEISTDEGDGFEVFCNYDKDEGPTLEAQHYEEWADQLSYAAEWCRKQAKKMAGNTTLEPNDLFARIMRKLGFTYDPTPRGHDELPSCP